MTSAVVGVIAIAVTMHLDCPVRHPSPKKSPGPRIATTASLPLSLTTVSFTFTLLNVHDSFRGISLGEDGFFFSELEDLSSQAGRVEKHSHIESRTF
jgi:hypothetical protein